MLSRKMELVTLPIFLQLVWILLPNNCASLPVQQPPSPVSLNSQQLQSLMRDAIKFIQKQQQATEHKPKIRFMVDPSYTGSGSGPVSGGTSLVKLRNIRSGFGDVANVVRLYQLHELEKEWASKARPRFGKRAEVAPENFLPPYALWATTKDDYYEPESRETYSSASNSKVPLGLQILPEDYAQGIEDRLKGERNEPLMKYPEDYSITSP